MWRGTRRLRDLKKLFDDQKVFQFPKPVGLLRRVLQVFGGRESSIVMDFFAGSGAFGHACWERRPQTR
ncbi:MAG: hypothetical protein IPG88_27075 [Gemmatimonadetes bacterium]|nr:hypothetical protein [Gemmatimonadota bacterium]